MTTHALMELAERLEMMCTIAMLGGDPNADRDRDDLKEAAAQLRTAASGVGEVHQAYWVLEDVWQDITAEQLAALDETEAVTRTLYLSPPGAEARDAGSLGLEVAYTEARVWKAEAMAARKLCDDWNKSAIAEGYGLGNVRACELLQAMDAAREAHEAKEESDAAIDAALRAREVSYPGTGKSEG